MGSPRLRVGIVDYLNSWPLAWEFLTGRNADRYEARYAPPAEVARLLAAGELDVGLVPSIEVPRIGGLEVVPGLCVAAREEVRSVLLVSRRPPREIRSVALDRNSRTSAALVEIVLRDRYGTTPVLESAAPDLDRMLERHDAALLIGDPALRVSRHRYLILDLAREWRRLVGHPFVFAVWAARPGVAGGELEDDFARSLEAGLDEVDAIVRRAVERLGLEPAEVREYLTRNLSYRMGDEEAEGLREFYRRAAAYGLIESCSRPGHSLEYRP